MKKMILVLIVFAGLVSAWYNPATPDMLDARYGYAKCDVEYAKDWLSMREGCGVNNNVTVFNSTEYVDDLDDDLNELREASEEGDQFEFGIGMFKLGADSLDLLGAIVKDAFTNKSGAFFSCVRNDEKSLKDDRNDCRLDAMEKEREASKDYVNNEIDHANGQIDELDEKGADTSGMEGVIDNAEELVDDADDAFDTGDVKEVRKLHLRHSRLVLLFRMEKMSSTIDYAKPIIKESDNSNKEEILEKMDELEVNIGDALEECEYSSTVDNNFDYSRENFGCWDESLDLFDEFNSIRLLILEGLS